MYIVTGGSGFIGSAMIWLLNEVGIDDILVVDNLAISDKWHNLVNRRFKDYIHRDEFRHLIQKGKAPEDIRAIFHMGACSSTTERNADFLMENNFHYTQMVCRYALENGARFINASSAATFGDGSKGFSDNLLTTLALKPLNMYGYSKQLFDLWAYREGLLNQIVNLKFFNVYGPNEYHKGRMASVIFHSFNQINATGKVKLFRSHRPDFADGQQLRDFIYVKDIADVICFMISQQIEGKNKSVKSGIYNLGTGKARSFYDLAAATFNAMERDINIEFIDIPEDIRDKYQYFTEADMNKLRTAGYDKEFTSLENGVSDYVKNYLMKRQ